MKLASLFLLVVTGCPHPPRPAAPAPPVAVARPAPPPEPPVGPPAPRCPDPDRVLREAADRALGVWDYLAREGAFDGSVRPGRIEQLQADPYEGDLCNTVTRFPVRGGGLRELRVFAIYQYQGRYWRRVEVDQRLY